MHRFILHLFILVLIPALVDATEPGRLQEQAHVPELGHVPPMSLEQSLGKMVAVEPFVVEVVAAEPLVQDPVAFDWGADGRLWVVEMADYPLGLDGRGRPGGRVKVLDDADGDGKFDRATLFADSLSTPNGIMVWRNGVLLTACPDVLYLEDTNLDGKADRIEKLYSGFNEGNQQHRVNGLRWGLDNWIYLANGDSGGNVVSHRTGQRIDIRGRDLRIRPNTGEIETQSGQSQFGRNCDDWGNWFGSNNPNPIFHYVLDETFLRRNPHTTTPSVRRDIRVGEPLVYPIGPIISHCDPKYRAIGATPIFTSACSTIVYRDTLFGDAYQNVTFTSEPVYNIVHARKLLPKGVTFESVKLHDGETEFLRSADPWSRPTGLRIGPDGALYVADMVREVIEHPEWIDDELEKTIDVRAGAELGRIYRVSPRGSERRRVPRFDQMKSTELVDALDSPSGWQRDLVQRMILWNADIESTAVDFVPPLQSMLASNSNPLARLHALATLAGLNQIEVDDIVIGLRDAHPGVRCHALRILGDPAIANRILSKHPEIEIEQALRSLVNDNDSMVQLNLAYALGAFHNAWSADILAELSKKTTDVYVQAALLSSVHADNVSGLITELVRQRGKQSTYHGDEFLGKVAAITIKLRQPTPVSMMLEKLSPNDMSWQLMQHWLASLGNASRDIESHLDANGIRRFQELIATARGAAQSPDSPLAERVTAVKLLGSRKQQPTIDIDLFTGFLAPHNPVELQQTAAEALANSESLEVAKQLTETWKTHGPRLRQQTLTLLLSRVAWTKQLLEKIENSEISQNTLSESQRAQLLQHRDDAIRKQATRLFGTMDADRAKAIDRFASATHAIAGNEVDLSRGRELFAKKCAVCHKLGGVGNSIGPDLATITNRTPDALLTAIIDPNRAVEAKYQQYQILLADGRVKTGIVVEETATSVELATAEGKVQTLLRNEIELMQGSDLSLMPVGLEKDLSVEQMADLLAYLAAI